MWLFLIFVAVPIIEIGLFIQVGGILGLWPTLAIVITTALVGTALMRAQGLAALQKLQTNIETGGNPTDPIANGAFILVAGLLLLTPGFFTDALGMAFLIPPVRQSLIRTVAARLKSSVKSYAAGYGAETKYTSDAVVEGEFEVAEDNMNSKPGDSGWTRPEE
ncbi:MAG: FxsA family protein [Paracoccaceae bacterium]